ncbi:MAG: UDP-galactopyranose mutase [Clostridia bacterium]
MKKYDYLFIGAGLFSAVVAHHATKLGKSCLVIDKREHIGGNIYCEQVGDIAVHKYGAHIFHTSDEEVWSFVNEFVEFNNFVNSPIANYKGELFNLPFNMNTFYKLWGTKTPAEAKAMVKEQAEQAGITEPKNLEEQAISLVGKDMYEKLIKGYTEKQWGTSATELPAFIIKRVPLRFTYDNNYFNDKYQGITDYNLLIQKLFEGSEIKLAENFFDKKEEYESMAETLVFTGMIDEYFDYKFGELEYRSLRFEHQSLEQEDYQGNAVINYTERDIPFTRIIEHKHFLKTQSDKTVVTREYPATWTKGDEPYYPINNKKNDELFAKYKELADSQKNVIFGGRLGEYKYYDMDKVIKSALELCKKI